jgi:hypothetical protein
MQTHPFRDGLDSSAPPALERRRTSRSLSEASLSETRSNTSMPNPGANGARRLCIEDGLSELQGNRLHNVYAKTGAWEPGAQPSKIRKQL